MAAALRRPRDIRLEKLQTSAAPNFREGQVGTAEELSQSSEKLIKKVTSGKISLSHALGFADLMEHRRLFIETEDHEKRLRAVEQRAGRDGKKAE
jgi:hypothetical protein